MVHHNGAGIAAPQIGVFKRIIYFGFEENPDILKPMKFLRLF